MPDIRCPNCSMMNREGAVFCRNCGAKLPPAVPQTVLAGPEAGFDQPSLSHPAPPASTFNYQAQLIERRPSVASAADSRSWLKTSAHLAAVLLGIAFVLLISFALPMLNVAGSLLDGEKFKTALREQQVYTRFPDLFAEQMSRSQAALGQQARINFSGITTADWKLIATELVTPQWMQTQVESLIDQTIASAKAGAAPPQLKLSLTEVTQRLGSDAGFSIYKKIITTKRSCGLDDFFDIVDWISQEPNVKLPICNIPPLLTDFAALFGGYANGDDLIRDLLKELPGAIPKEIALSTFFSLRMDRLTAWLKVLTILAWVSLLLGLGALLAMLVSPFVRTLKGWLLSWGICLGVAGMVGLIASLVLPYSLGGLIVGAFSKSLAPSISKIILETGRTVTQTGANALFWQSAIMLLAGLAMLATGVLLWAQARFRNQVRPM